MMWAWLLGCWRDDGEESIRLVGLGHGITLVGSEVADEGPRRGGHLVTSRGQGEGG